MKPDEPNNSQGGMSLSQQGPLANTSDNLSNGSSQEAAANIIRSQIDNIYSSSTNDDRPVTAKNTTQQEDTNPYLRTHSDKLSIQTSDWKKYHTAWQNYYQKYYEGYYSKHLNNAREAMAGQSNKDTGFFANNTVLETEEPITKDEALFEMRQNLIGKVTASAKKIKKSRHFLPILSGIIVVLFFLFMQYNRALIANVAAYVSPGNIDPQNIVVDPNANLAVAPEPRLIIPKINVDVPVVYDIGNDYDSQMSAMTKGVAHFAVPGASSRPGEIGNTVISGHSSNDLLDPGDYKFIFAQLEKLEVGDTIYANYNSKRYTYTVTKKEVVAPTQVSALVYETNKPIVTLLTCTPLGTATNRLLVTAEQVSPDPSQSLPAPENKSTTKSIPGNSPTFFERLFGNNG